MKRTFLRILPLAVAVLLATSCSKDENNDNAVVNNGQENVQTKTMPISITVNQKGLSKLGCTGAIGEDLQPIFKPGDKLAIYIKDGGKLKDLEVKEENITNDGKTAIFEGEIVGAGLVDKETVLTAEIGTQIQSAITATSREDAVQQGCYQISEPFVYSKDGNSIALEEQNAYIEVVWTNKGNATVEFTVNDSKNVSLTLNDEGQGWIVVPAETTFTCAALGLTSEITTVAANIYGITRTFTNISLDKTTASVAMGKTETLTATTVPNGQEVTWSSSDPNVATVANGVVTPIKEGTTTITATFGELSATCTVTVIPEGYVDLGVTVDDKPVFWAQNNLEGTYMWGDAKTAASNNNAELPTKADFEALANACYWVWQTKDGVSGMYAFKLQGSDQSNYQSPAQEFDVTYKTDGNVPYIFLPAVFGGGLDGVYWSGEPYGGSNAFCLHFNEYVVDPDDLNNVDFDYSVRLVRRSN